MRGEMGLEEFLESLTDEELENLMEKIRDDVYGKDTRRRLQETSR